MVSATATMRATSSYTSSTSVTCGTKRPFAATLHAHTHHHAIDSSSMHATADPTQKRSPLLCGYPSKKCWAWRVEKRNGELHKFCEYHRQKANTNQRRMEQRRKIGRPTTPKDTMDSDGSKTDVKFELQSSASASALPAATVSTSNNVVIKTEAPVAVTSPASVSYKSPLPHAINTVLANAEKAAAAIVAAAAAASSPRGIEHFDYVSPPHFKWADVDLDIGLDAAVEYMMIDHAIDAEPSDTPVDLYEEDLYFLEHFIAEIAATGV